ncbi:tRNA (N(6)-L-threonylcarbamoyladenosine(37)-C(2))-methylthiotransferase MtaB [Paralimibaculum aggregatum]|uniref:tRNA (N(6)-L-threonylcarbamoyladenosine(37)-C(2))-methylthiotransferase MtaB n=1 Tax=Paralimibaculum aggregatum TaxID=3036245 RepID=A0ABQ6LKV6_9RHOB|nr:tRNA (N(6)-L-threonylcarbamoyladenosine(37)-C(2))-methylthiotransferase MtaB [Limibaculum sp. NKW23]GMG80920.1 tRNA (N(6)-L-threonylcarbamoyladenosine(37)-C(2))-methylthiotransferase MtaB [Limibaculum sp. NKW23]
MSALPESAPGVPEFATFGCRLNAYESEAMAEMAAAAGLTDAVVVNTCAVTAEAVRQARQQIRKLARENPGRPVIVTGCAAQTEPETFAAMPEVAHVLGNAEKMAPASWARLAGGAAERVAVADIQAVRETAGHLIDGFGTRARAYVQVQNGCDHRCTFCIIPYGRGPSRSVPAGVVVEQIRRLVGRGYNEVVLTGVDLTSWGDDLPGRPPLGNLVQRILRLVPELPRLRISSIDSIEADPALVEAIAGEPRLMPHLHLSLQAGDDLILKRMKRRHLRDDAIRFCAEIRAARPEVVFGADLIAGFPTETEAAFERTLALVEDCGLTWLHVFPYSARKGTPAARMPQVPVAERKARAARLRAAGARAAAAHLAAQAGREHAVLMESARRGRTAQFAEVVFAEDRPVGGIVPARITGHDGGRLRAAPLPAAAAAAARPEA